MTAMEPQTQPAAPAGALRFSAAALPAPDRVGIWREEFGQRFVRLDMETLDDAPLHYDASFQFLGDTSVGVGDISAISCARTRPLIADGNDDIVFLMPISGVVRVEQGQVDETLGPGDGLVRCSSEVGRTRSRAGRFVTLSLPVRRLAERVADVDRLVVTVVPRQNDALGLLAGYCRMMMARDAPLGDGTGHVAREHLLDLAALAIGANRDAWHVARNRGLRAARRAQARAAIRRNATDPGYRMADLAASMHASESYVRKLLAEEGATFSALLLEARLERARDRLADPRRRAMQIGQIALDCGFGDISYFNRCFARRFGQTPTDMRRAE